ncbi:MAG: hypothetical protein O2807_06240 [bacterium]|nr:hypothetical protein [bacterium]
MKNKRWLAALAGAMALWAIYTLFPLGAAGLAAGDTAPEFRAGPWLNSAPLKLADLRGKVVLIKMWTFG